jgi:hypothetical protein
LSRSVPRAFLSFPLYIYERTRSQPDWKDKIEDRVLWLELLHPFTAVKNLYLSEKIALRIGPALQELLKGRTAEVLPALDNIFLEGFESSGRVQEGIGQFIGARQSASHPIAISPWPDAEQDMVLVCWQMTPPSISFSRRLFTTHNIEVVPGSR